ncbi:hypothetical protein Palpr_2761 [Paludibacter propionicigenes WB4]|uniref:Uncharacterized protein n=1 Tax=Paludibacter propionicigenes (strain DSM 17365 / JCM 13257 / WB4) TaxID=694427 RepID=E4T847_PALPW|nr:DUF6261 family protein [Paludibacter propionicigenes]ADQ80891.1 hypothetical protein Palpr_2761 [Paludibacter propionicigenes WB4]
MKRHLTALNVDTLGQLGVRVSEISAPYGFASGNPLLERVNTVKNVYVEVLDKNTYSGHGKLVRQADGVFDNRFLRMRDLLTSFIDIDGLAAHQDAVDLYAVFDTHGLDLYHMSYGDELIHADALIADLDKRENQGRIARLNLQEVYALLKEAYQVLKSLTNEQTTANAALRAMESSTSLRRNLEDALRSYLDYVDIMAQIDANWKPMQLELIEAVKAAVNSKRNSPKKDDKTTKTK